MQDNNYIDIPRIMLESYGYDVDGDDKIINESYADSENEKLFGIDRVFSNDLNNTVDFILNNESFNGLVDQIYETTRKTDNVSLYAKWKSDSLLESTLSEAVKKELSHMYNGEVMQYENIVDNLFKEHSINESYQTIKNNGYDFSVLPRIVRIH